MTVKLEDIMDLQKSKDSLKSKVEQSKGRRDEIAKQIEDTIVKMGELGVTPETIEAEITKTTEKLETSYAEAVKLRDSIRDIVIVEAK